MHAFSMIFILTHTNTNFHPPVIPYFKIQYYSCTVFLKRCCMSLSRVRKYFDFPFKSAPDWAPPLVIYKTQLIGARIITPLGSERYTGVRIATEVFITVACLCFRRDF